MFFLFNVIMFLPCDHELWTNWRRSLFPDRRRPPSHAPWPHWTRQWRLAWGWLWPPRRQKQIWTRSSDLRGWGGWTGPGCHTSPSTTAPWDQQPWTAGGGWAHWEDHPKGKQLLSLIFEDKGSLTLQAERPILSSALLVNSSAYPSFSANSTFEH